MRKRVNALICILTSVCLLSPISVQAAQTTARVPNDAIDISSTELSYNLRNQNGNTIWAKNGTVEYNGNSIVIDAYPVMNDILFPRESYSLSIEGSNITKTLVKDGYTEEKYIYNNHAYGFDDKYDDGTILGCSLLPIYQTSKRLGLKRGHVKPFSEFFMSLTLDYTLEELKKYSSMTDFVNKTGYSKSNKLLEGSSPGYVTDLENTALDQAKRQGYNDIDSYTSYLCEKEEYAKCEIVKETWYPIYFIVSKNLVSHELVESVAEKHNYSLYEKGDFYYLKAASTNSYAYYNDYNYRAKMPQLAKELNVNSDQIEFSYHAETRDVYHTYYDFTGAQLADAIAAEMDTWSGRWDYFLYGDEHFNYWYGSDSVAEPGYYAGNWGSGFSVIQDQITVNYEPEYQYTITGPGRVTIKITGREDQNGHGSANLKGTDTIYLDVVSTKKNGWMQDSTGWWYRNADGTYPVNQWQLIDNKWYHFDRNGYMQIGWLQLGNTWYYLNTDGGMVTGWQMIGGSEYYFVESGEMSVGWRSIDGTYYYFVPSGAMATGWVQSGASWYYMDPTTGKMATGFVSVKGATYYMNASGAMLTGWFQIGGKWYYAEASGAIAKKGWVGNYYLDKDGVMVTYAYVKNGAKYYWVNSSGVYTKTYAEKDTAGYVIYDQATGTKMN